MAKKRFDVLTPVSRKDERGEEKTYWTKLGAAWENEDSIAVFLDALPTNGKLVLKVPKPRDEEPRR